MKGIKEKIRALAAEYLDEVVAIRRHFHAHPEISTREAQTAAYISSTLTDWNIPHQTGIAGHGVVALIKGHVPGEKVIALRADMDALQIQEENPVEYASKNEGVMHACGHDVHMASLLGTAKILKYLEKDMQGTVKLIFQPSEEVYPGGALPMIRAGVLENPKPDLIIGQHVYPEMSAGSVGMREGYYMASTDEVHLTVRGKGGHAAIPHKLVDPLLIGAHILLALQQIVSRNAQPTNPTVLTFGRFIADGRANVVPDVVRMSGTMRTFDEAWRKEIREKIARIAVSMAESMGGSCEVFIDQGYPAVYNHPELTGRVMDHAREYLGEERVETLEMRMTAEDFSYFAMEVPGCFYRLGVMNAPLGITSNLHTSTFDVDEESLGTGMGLMAWIAFNELLKPG